MGGRAVGQVVLGCPRSWAAGRCWEADAAFEEEEALGLGSCTGGSASPDPRLLPQVGGTGARLPRLYVRPNAALCGEKAALQWLSWLPAGWPAGLAWLAAVTREREKPLTERGCRLACSVSVSQAGLGRPAGWLAEAVSVHLQMQAVYTACQAGLQATAPAWPGCRPRLKLSFGLQRLCVGGGWWLCSTMQRLRGCVAVRLCSLAG